MKTASEKRADELSEHIDNVSVRQRVRDNILKTLENLNKIRSLSESSEDVGAQPKDSNGIDSLDINELDARESARIENLKRINILSGALDEEEGEEAPLPVRVDKVLAASSNINAKGKFGYTKMHQAVVSGNIEAVRIYLCDPEIDLSITDRSGSTALDKAWAMGENEIALLLGGTLAEVD